MNLLCLIAHPDDETLFCGGTLALLAARGAAVHVACLTRGEGGELGEPPLADREHLGEVREQELVCAVQQLGGKSLTFLGYLDPVVGPDDQLFAPEHEPALLAGQIVNTLKQFKIDGVLTHGSNGEYGHPAHTLLHQTTFAAVAALHQEQTNASTGLSDFGQLQAGQPQAGQPQGLPLLDYPTTRLPDHLTTGLPDHSTTRPLLYTFSAIFPNHPYSHLANKDDPADIVLDVSAMLDRKEAAALCHKTQTALFVRRRSREAGRELTVREVLLTVEGLHRVYGEPDDELSRLLMVK